jgi:hypothetical protein
MVRGRLTRINGVEVSAASYTDDRAQRLIDREFNLSMRPDLPEGNRQTAGRWFSGRRSRGQGKDAAPRSRTVWRRRWGWRSATGWSSSLPAKRSS